MEADRTSYEARELNWQLYTKAGNQQMQAQLYSQAQQSYSLAMEMAELLLEEAQSNLNHSDAIHPYAVSHHNLVDAYLKLGGIQQAEATLQRVYTRTIAVMNDRSLPSKLRLESFMALKIISFEIDRFYRQRDRTGQAETLLAQANQQAQAFLAEFDFRASENLQAEGSVHFRRSSPD